MSRRYMAPAPPDSSSDSSPKRLIGSDTAVSDSASGSASSVSGLRSSSVSCRRSRLTLFAYSWVPHFEGVKKAAPQPVHGLGGGLGVPLATQAAHYNSHCGGQVCYPNGITYIEHVNYFR